jgi:hypothetical protein
MSKRFIAGFFAIAVMPILSAIPASAISYSIVLNETTTAPATSLGFQAPDFGGGTVDNATGSVSGQYRSPWEGTGNEALSYTSVRSGTVGYNIAGLSLSLLWGSPDSYNRLTFHTGENGTGDSTTVFGASIGAPQGLGFHLVQFVTDQVFKSITISSDSAAFEFANLTATPIPPALLLFLSGLGAMGWLGRKRRAHATP